MVDAAADEQGHATETDAPARIPVFEAPEIEPDDEDAPTDEAEPCEGSEGSEGSEGAESASLISVEQEVKAEVEVEVETEAEPEPEPEPEPGPEPDGAADETTALPRVSGQTASLTAVIPAVGAPHSTMARRPYNPASADQGSARQVWGGDEHGGVDLPPNQFQLRAPAGEREREPGRRVGRRALLAGAGVLVAAVAGLGATGAIKPGRTAAEKAPAAGFVPATDSGASAATQTGTAFLTAWQNGQLEVAAAFTDDPKAALAALRQYTKNLGVVGMVMNPNAANAVGWMTYAVTMQGGSPMGQWEYEGGFATYAKNLDGYSRWFVQWDPSITYASLKAGYQLKIKKTPASVKGLVDRNNQPIDPAAHPSLAGTVTALTAGAVPTGATDGQEIIMVDAAGSQLAKVATLTPPIDNGTVATTLDMTVQAALEAAVTFHANSSMVAIQPSTGHILAFANRTTDEYYDDALLTRVAPGSTFKIITSTALLSKGLTTLASNVPCPSVINIDSLSLHNSVGESGDYTYQEDFAASCNNAFSSFWDVSGMTSDLLSDTAKTYFGLNQKWDIGFGTPTQYMNIPAGLHRGDLAESLVGQGDVVSCPLAMCSIAATVATGEFKQPILLPDHPQPVTATPLGAKLQGELKTLMAGVIATGTARGIFPTNGHFFGKTGTAEYGPTGDPKNNSWFVVFDDQHDLALCALAIDAGAGAANAAPECQKVFEKLNYL